MKFYDPTDRAQFDEAVRQVDELMRNWHKKPAPDPEPERQVSNLEKICMRCGESAE